MKRFGFPSLSCLAGALFMVVSQANVHAVVSNDTFSQLTSTLFGCASVYFICFSLFEKEGTGSHHFSLKNRGGFLSGILLFALALFSKETGVGFLFCILLLIFLRFWKARPIGRSIYLFAVIAAPFALITMIYSLIWMSVIPVRLSEGTGTYGMSMGMNGIRNIFFLGSSMITPRSSVDIFVANAMSDKAAILSAIMMSSIFLLSLIAGIIRTGKKRLTAVLILLMLTSLIPVLALNHVSELYSYAAMPFFSVIVGIAAGGLIGPPGKSYSPVRITWILIFISIFTASALAVVSKTEKMKVCGERASRLIDEIVDLTGMVPAGGDLLLVNRPVANVEYSIFLINDFNLLRYGDHVIRNRSGRDDVTIEIISPPFRPDRLKEGTVVLGLSDKDEVILIPQQ